MEYAKIFVDTIVIEDTFSLPESEILSLARTVAQERAASHNWTSIEVRPTSKRPIEAGATSNFYFEVYALPIDLNSVGVAIAPANVEPNHKPTASSPNLIA